jgi:transcriptional regulator
MFYNPPAFRQTDIEKLHDEIDAIGFATLISMGRDAPLVTQLPLVLDRAGGPRGTLLGHMARDNPQWQSSDLTKPAVALFCGPQAYVTPSFYPSKQKDGRVSPTWNYTVVYVRGRLTVFEDPKALLAQLSTMTDRQEKAREHPWRVADAPADYNEAKLGAIVGVRLEIDAIEGKAKLSQNRDDADRTGVTNGLAASADPMDKAIAARMARRDD